MGEEKEDEMTTLSVAKPTREIVRDARNNGESYDHFIRRIIKIAEKKGEINDIEWEGKLDWKETR